MTTKKSAAIKYLESLVGPLSFAKMIESERLSLEMSQVEFAKKLKISKSNLCDLEKGRKFVSLARAVKFAKILKLDEDLWVLVAMQDLVDRAGLKYKVEIRAA